MNYRKNITKDEINELPLYRFEGKIHLITHENQIDTAIKKLNKCSILGFDTETKPCFKKGQFFHVSLLQLSTEDEAFLFRLNEIPLHADIISILSNENIKKVGVAVHDDIKGLQKIHHFTPGGFIDIALLAKEKEITTFGLRALSAIFLNFRMSKKITVSNWARNRLSNAQINYAALDAWAGLQIYKKLITLTK